MKIVASEVPPLAQPGSPLDRVVCERDLRLAGWYKIRGWWAHATVGGLHNLTAAYRIFASWII